MVPYDNSGYIGDHMELRHFLSGSVILYAGTVYLFGAGQSWGVRSIWYYYVVMGLQVPLSIIIAESTQN